MNKMNTKKLTITALLGAITIVLAVTPLGFIPLGAMNATIMHIPVIIAGILEGPLTGALVGLIFGITSLVNAILRPTITFYVLLNPLVSIFPRIMIGLVSSYVYKFISLALKDKKSPIAIASSAVAGSLTNSILVMGMIYLLYAERYMISIGQDPAFAKKFILGIIITNGIPESIVAALITLGIVRGVMRYKKR
ncbi:MAG: ECF transporter S component [Tissierellia bacterium]|nr:ECF transporter S component [Tissierellia bacterium]